MLWARTCGDGSRAEYRLSTGLPPSADGGWGQSAAAVSTAAAVSAGVEDTASVEMKMGRPVLGVQKPARWLGQKRFQNRFLAALERSLMKEKKPGGLQMRPSWRRLDRLGACPAVGRGDADCLAGRPRPCTP